MSRDIQKCRAILLRPAIKAEYIAVNDLSQSDADARHYA